MLDKQLLRQRAEQLRGEPRPARPRKTYLSRADRQEAMVLAAIAGKLDELIAAWEDRRKSGVLLRAAKLARYWTYQALEQYLAGVEQDSIDRLLHEVGRSEITVKEA